MYLLRCLPQSVAWGALSVGLLFCLPAVAQPASDSVQLEAQRDFHGPDLKNKDGPLAKAGLDLLVLYHRHHQLPDPCTFPPEKTPLPVTDDHVVIDAVAEYDPARLHADLDSLGLKHSAIAGRIVSGHLPISQIPSMAKLASLRQAKPAERNTHPSPRLPFPRDSTSLLPDTSTSLQ